MGRTHHRKAVVATSWLPGFEPEGFEHAQLNAVHELRKDAVNDPPSPVREVSVMAARVVFEAMTQTSANPTALSAREVQEVVTSPDVESLETGDLAVKVDQSNDEGAANDQKEWPIFDSSLFAPAKGNHERISVNIKALKLVKDLAATGRAPTDEDRHTLLSYVGWGGLAKIFEEIEGNTLQDKQDELKSVLSTEEFASARASTINAFYTDPVVIRAMWDAVIRLGFKGGRIIEPSAGTGMFLAGMPRDIAMASDVTAVELDKVSGEILRTVFGGLGVQTQISGIEKANVPSGFYDLAISNVPFGDYQTLEARKVGYAHWSIHNYFFGKAVDLVRPGGLIAFVTSTGTMDSKSSAHRMWLEAHAELLGAIRLPRNAFKNQAGTDVVADIIVMKKRAQPQFSEKFQWLSPMTVPEEQMAPGQSLRASGKAGYFDLPRVMNEWFVQRPGMVIGHLMLQSDQFGNYKVIPEFHGDKQAFESALANCVRALPADVYEARKTQDQINTGSLPMDRIKATHMTRVGAFLLHDGKICISEGSTWVDVDAAFKGTPRGRLLGLMKIRDAARALIEQQTASSDEKQFKSLQFTLNMVYDAFVSEYGNVADRANTKVFRTDPDCPLVLSLEFFDEDKERYQKADIFTKRTAGKKQAPTSVETAKDAMLVSLSVHGRIDLTDMARRLNTNRKSVVSALRDEALAFIDPMSGAWTPSDEYLSGNIREKIAAASAAGQRYQSNVRALQSVLPKDLGPGEVEVRLGAPWIPTDMIGQFACELIATDSQALSVGYDGLSSTWNVTTTSYRPEYVGNRVLNTATWGTSHRCAVELIEAALNQQPPKITTTVDGKTYVNKAATLAAREKYEAIKAEFKKWAYADDGRRDRLLRLYNDLFNQIVNRRYDGSHLVLYGMSNVITPYPHQLDAIWRIVSGGNTLLAHVVGAGKTFTMVAAAMELRRIGKANKPCAVVPNHMLEQFAGDCVRFYPTAKILMASKEDFTGDRRREFCARVVTGDWDMVVMTHSTFERLPMRPQTTARFVEQVMGGIRIALVDAKNSQAKRSVKQLEKMMKSIEVKIDRALNDGAKDDLVYFDDLGIDHLMVDEAHLFKNLMRISKMPAIAGLPNVSSNRAFDLWVKTATIMESRGEVERGVTFATATPIANSIAELHVMMKFLQPYTLREMGLYEFDAWAATFGEAVQGMEVAPDGSGYRLNTRFARFVNVPELMSIFRLVADIQTRSMLKLPTPDVKGGKPRTFSSPASAELTEYTASLVERANAIRNGSVKPEDDNMLAVTNCGRKAALDMRLVNPLLPFDKNGKVAQICAQVVRIWGETSDRKGAQMVFCDLSTPNSIGFSVYKDLKLRLVEAGIPEKEIAFVHDYESDAAKAKLFRMVRAGIIRVLMGSTLKMGVGTNAQRVLKAVHQIDAPWRPSDVEQRDGRGLRVGNEFTEIELLRYVTEGSFDAYMWQTLEVKARFIDQVMTSQAGIRSMEDLSMGALTFAEIKAIASGNPMVLEKATIDAEVMKYSVIRDQWVQDRWRWSQRHAMNDELVGVLKKRRTSVSTMADNIAREHAAGWTFVPQGGVSDLAAGSSDPALQIGAQLLYVSRKTAQGFCGETLAGAVAGLQIILRRYNGLSVVLQNEAGDFQYEVDRTGVPITLLRETGQRVLDGLMVLSGQSEIDENRIRRLEEENRDIAARLQQDFEYEEKLDAVQRRQREIEALLDLDKDQDGAEAAVEAAI